MYIIFVVEMILERLNLQELLEEEKKNLEELEKLKTSQRSNPPKQKSPGVKSEVNKTTGIIVERTIENIDHNHHTSADSGAEKAPDFASKLRNSQLVSKTDTEPDKEQNTEADSKPNISSELVSKTPLNGKQVNKSLNIHDVSLTDMLDSSIEDDENANVSSIVGSLCVGSTYTNTSQSSFVSTNNQKSNRKLSVPSKTSTPIRSHQDKNIKVNPNFKSGGSRGLFSSTEENRPLVPPDDNQATNQIRIEKSTVRKAIENRLTQVNHRSNPTEPSMDGSEANHDFLSTIEGEHKLICVTDKQAKKSKENSGKKLVSKLKQKLNALASGKKQDDTNMKPDKDDFEEENPIVGRKRKRMAVIEDDDDGDIFDSINASKNEDSMKVDRAASESSKAKGGVSKPVKVKTKPSKPAVKHNSEEVSAKIRSSGDSVPPTVRRDTEDGSKVSKSTLSKLQKFAFDDSRSDRSASSDSFVSNSSLSSSMLSGSLWLSDKTGTKSNAKSKSDRDNMVNSHGHEGVDSHINVDAESMTDASSNWCSTVNEKSSTKDGQKADTNITNIESNYVSSLPSPVTSCDTATSKGGLLQKLKSPDMTKEMKAKNDKSNHTGFRMAKTVSSFGHAENSKVNSVSKTEMPNSAMKTKKNDPGVKNTSILTGSSPSWLAALKSKKPSPIFSISESNDLDLELDDLEFSDNPFKRPKFS